MYIHVVGESDKSGEDPGRRKEEEPVGTRQNLPDGPKIQSVLLTTFCLCVNVKQVGPECPYVQIRLL